MGLTQAQAETRTRQRPDDPTGWKSLGAHCLETDRPEQARASLERALALAPQDTEALLIMGDLECRQGNLSLALEHLETLLAIDPGHVLGKLKRAEALHRLGRYDDALRCLEDIPPAGKHRASLLSWQGVAQLARQRYDEARQAFEALIEIEPGQYSAWNNLGNVHRDLGNLKEAAECYGKAASLTRVDPQPKSNQLTALHYHPDATVETILQACKEWGAMFVPDTPPVRPVPADRSPGKVVRLGMFSDGFRQHPVGAMTTSALEHLAKLGVEIYAYTTNNSVDSLTRRIMALSTKWTPISHLDHDRFAQLVRDDGIDILMDLSGHNAGSRIRTMALQPAPILVKWVGGLINTTGVEAIDYLITDGIESPPGSDHLYTEKLIRLPDDYICFMPPQGTPAVGPLPALKNGYVTFGCFNNPTKINEIVLAQWAQILHALPGSRLFLKGAAYGTEALRQRVLDTLAQHGIAADRVRIEGRSPHLELLARYNEVDIALDPWPYSGGLTTCEAMLMGVPVVSLPGPTFAGRHSATHLVNAGMPELVVQDWEQYRARALELAADLQSLGTIREHLRQVLLDSPVCDSARFGRNLANALRAIWQRYCAGKAPGAMTFTPEGQPWFEDEDGPMKLVQPDASALGGPDGKNDFSFSFQGKIVTLDHGSALIENPLLQAPGQMGALDVIVLDPASRLQEAGGQKREKYIGSYHSHIALGDGEPGILYTCLNAEISGTLKPLPPAKQLSFMRQHASVLAKLPIATVRLDSIDGLDRLDWLILNDTHDNKKILQGAERVLEQTLIVHIRVLLAKVFEKQPDMSALSQLLAKRGFNLLQVGNPEYGSYFPEDGSTAPYRGSQQISMDAVFIPSEARLKTLTANQRLKLAFLLYTSYKAPDAAYAALRHSEGGVAERYLAGTGWSNPETTPAKKRFVHICYNNMHTQKFLSLLAKGELDADFIHQAFVEQHRSIPGYDNDLSNCEHASFFNHKTDLPRVIESILAPDVAGVFIHGLFFDWQQQLIEAVGDKKKVYWITWGGDLYNPIKQGRPLHYTVKYIHAIATSVDGDYRLFCETYGEKPRIWFAYPADMDFAAIDIPSRKSKRIFVGNSGDPSNLHIEILDNLAGKQDISDYEVIIPLAYNLAPAYASNLLAHIEKLRLPCKTRAITEYMPARDYYAMLADAEILITAHHRQQAYGNLVASLYFGNKTILRKEIHLNDTRLLNPNWEFLTRTLSTEPIDYTDLLACKRLADLPIQTTDSLRTQRDSILEFYRNSTLTELLRKQFMLAA